MKTFEEFKSALKSGEFKAELQELAKTAKEKAVSEKDAHICEFAKKMGYDVSVEDLAAERAAAKEMPPEDLEAVAGGTCSALEMARTPWCWSEQYCYLVLGCVLLWE